MPRCTEKNPCFGPRQSVLRGGVIDPVDAGALSAVVANSFVPTEEEWAGAAHRGSLVVRSLAEGDVRAWMPAARNAWEQRLARLTAEAERRGVRLLLWPHAQDVVSDVPGLVMFCRSQPNLREGWGVLLDPHSLLTEQMMANAEDHLARVRDAVSVDFVRQRVAAVVERESPVAGWWDGPLVRLAE